MARTTIDQLIVNSPYEEPARHWSYDRTTHLFDLAEGRRPAGYVIASEGSRSFDDPGHFIEIPLVNRIRPCVRAWREAGYPGVTGITKRLLEHWTDPEEFDSRRFFFCQTEAAETPACSVLFALHPSRRREVSLATPLRNLAEAERPVDRESVPCVTI